jgi:hypothetical protein
MLDQSILSDLFHDDDRPIFEFHKAKMGEAAGMVKNAYWSSFLIHTLRWAHDDFNEIKEISPGSRERIEVVIL